MKSPQNYEWDGMEGKVLTGIFDLAGYRFMALDGGPHFKFTPAISFFVRCRSADQVDEFWSSLYDGGTVLMPVDTFLSARDTGGFRTNTASHGRLSLNDWAN
jgi:predicted 3-demethylubiquinone-9 3-methyltransferase (glyoxalase superfamily)